MPMMLAATQARVTGAGEARFDEVLTTDALDVVAGLHERFEARRREILDARAERQRRLDAGHIPDFLPNTRRIRDRDWQVSPVPEGLRDRRVEITGPVERKMVINALNSGACTFMADFEDSNAPTWHNCVAGQINLRDAVRGTIEHTGPDGRQYRLGPTTAALLVRPRGWHLVERHVEVGGDPVSAGLFDVGLYLYHNAAELLARGAGPWLYLPKLEGHLEARLWRDVFVHMEEVLGLPTGTIRATVLIENILAAFEMDEILYELRDHAAGLNAGRWDYIFSIIRKLRTRPEHVLPDRAQVTMSVPFMRAYTDLLVRTCHRRGAHAMGGMSAFIPSRRDEQVNAAALAQVRADKQREAGQGFDGTWVAHPDLVAVAREQFDAVLGDRPNQLDVARRDVAVTAADLLDTSIDGAAVTERGLRDDVRVAILYLASWLCGNGAAAIDNLMEDAATAEIARAQVWQWVHHGVALPDGRVITADLVREIARDLVADLRAEIGDERLAASRIDEARSLFEDVSLGEPFTEFLTIPASDHID